MYLHNAFQDEQIIPLWVKRGTEGIRARYTNAGEYTEYDSVIRYHQGRPHPEGKLILHATTTPGHRGRRRRQDGQGRVAHGGHRIGPDRPRGRQGVPRHVLAERGARQEGLGALGLVQVRDRLPRAGRRVEDLEVPLLRARPRAVRGELGQLRPEEPGRVRPRPDVLRRRRQAGLHAAGRRAGADRRTTRTARRPCRSSSRSPPVPHDTFTDTFH